MPDRITDHRITRSGETVTVDARYDDGHAIRVRLTGVSHAEQRQLSAAFSGAAELPLSVRMAVADDQLNGIEQRIITNGIEDILEDNGVSANVESARIVDWAP